MKLKLRMDKAVLAALKGEAERIRKATLAAAKNAGDKAQRRVVTSTVKYVQTKKNLKSTAVRKALRIERPGKDAGFSGLVWRVRIVSKAVPLVQYPASGKPLVVKVNKGKSSTLPHSFLATMRSGHRGVFRRKGGPRFPLVELYSSRVVDVVGDSGIVERLQREGQTAFRTDFEAGLEKQLAKGLGKGK